MNVDLLTAPGWAMAALTVVIAAIAVHPAHAETKGQHPRAISVEGEAPSRTNLTVKPDRRASGGRYLALATERRPPAQGWYATYTLRAPAAGTYRLDAVATSPAEGTNEDAANGSHVNLSLNGGPFRQVARSQVHWAGSPHAWGDLYRLRLDDVELRRGANTITFMVDEPALVSGSVLHRLLLDRFTLTPTALALRDVHLNDLNVYRAGEPADLHLRLNGRAPATQTVHYEIRDYQDAEVAAGTATIPAGSTTAKAPLPALRPGNFTVRASTSTSAVTGQFAQLPGRAPISGPANRFGANTWAPTLIASSKLAPLARALKRMGVGYIRDDASWSAAEPARGRYRATPQDKVTREFHRQGLKVLHVLTGPPDWTMSGTSVPLPADLRVAHGYTRHLSGKPAGARPDAVQMSNEPDIDDTASTGDQQAAYVKAAALGMSTRGNRPRIVLPGIGGNFAYQKLMLESDVVRYADAWAFHAYPWPPSAAEPEVPAVAAEQRRLWRRYGGTSQTWQTEFGLFLKTPGHDPDRQRQVAQARYLVRSTVQDLAAGVDKHFWFAGPPLGTEGTYFGLFNRDYQPLRSYSAHAAMASILGKADHVSRLQGLPPGATGHLFDTGTRSAAVLWAKRPTQVKVPVGGGKAEVYDTMGVRRVVNAERGTVTLTATPDPSYVLSTRTARAPEKASSKPGKPSPAEQIVLNQRYAPANAAPNKNNGEAKPPFGYRLKNTTRMSLDIYNFSGTPRKVVLSGHADGWTVKPIASSTVIVPPMGRAAVPFILTAAPQTRPGSDYRLAFTATLDGRPVPPSVSWIQLTK
ncbi:hypothetical protein [Spirillospora sp. CA-294931]|uniref:hypothetical protein n=1 Tax=Spirillospora sp. CA-294931 TaxID=3240042 RepID=UPI003D8DA98D